AAAVAEMLLQSTDDKIILLPALPDAWANGSVKGLVARGGFVLDIEWEKGKLVSAIIYSKTNANTKVKYNKTVKEIALKEGESYRFTAN
ncbi:MAG: glycoside hydrolase family 95 protein, partial [Bacteroidetes bacterium]